MQYTYDFLNKSFEHEMYSMGISPYVCVCIYIIIFKDLKRTGLIDFSKPKKFC